MSALLHSIRNFSPFTNFSIHYANVRHLALGRAEPGPRAGRLRLCLAGLVLCAIPAAAQPSHELCAACHTTVAKDFAGHPHAAQGLSCDTCHGKSEEHRLSGGGAEPDRVAAPDEMAALCGPCHDQPPKGQTSADPAASILKQYEASRHGIFVAERSKVRAPHCGTCHDTHRVRSLKAMQVRCQRCHGNLPAACSGEPPGPAVSELRCAGCHKPHLFAVAK